MKRLLICLLPFLCAVSAQGTTIGESLEKIGDRKRSNKERLNICKNYIAGVAYIERESTGIVSDMIQQGMDLIESNKGRYSDLCSIMDAHKMLVEAESISLSIKLSEAKRESYWIKEAKKLMAEI